jgi:hypothetical protein
LALVSRRSSIAARSGSSDVARDRRGPDLDHGAEGIRGIARAKTTEMRAAVAAGDITQAQFDRYDAELVACLK